MNSEHDCVREQFLVTPIKKSKDKITVSSQQISPIKNCDEVVQKIDPSCSSSVEETFVIKVSGQTQSKNPKPLKEKSDNALKIEEIQEEDATEEDIVPEIPIVITDDDILDVNEDYVGNSSRPQNRAGCRNFRSAEQKELQNANDHQTKIQFEDQKNEE